MADGQRGGGGFFWGAVLGGVAGFFLGSYLATEQGRQKVTDLRQRAGELATDPEVRGRAQAAWGAARDALGDAVKEGVTAARDRRQELTQAVTSTPAEPAGDTGTATPLAPPEEGSDG